MYVQLSTEAVGLGTDVGLMGKDVDNASETRKEEWEEELQRKLKFFDLYQLLLLGNEAN